MEYDFDTQLEVVSAFLEGFRRCDPEQVDDTPYAISLPAIICATFSIEVGLKTLLSYFGTNHHGHDLFKLYSTLPAHTQIQIREGSGYAKEQFENELKKARLSFIEWRYLYEAKEVLSVNLFFLGKVAASIQSISNVYINRP